MLDSIAQSYHWSFDDIMNLTVPQIILISHAAFINSKRFDEKLNNKQRSAGGSDYNTQPEEYLTPDSNIGITTFNAEPIPMETGLKKYRIIR
jgi:hypothetical protein